MKSALHTELQNKAQQYLLDKSYWITNVEMNIDYARICDVWGMKSDYDTCGIEVKISRADFKNNKYKEFSTEYNPMANRHYILCPAGLIQSDEVHPKWGLLWWNGKRIINKKQAIYIKMRDRKKLSVLLHLLCSKANKLTP